MRSIRLRTWHVRPGFVLALIVLAMLASACTTAAPATPIPTVAPTQVAPAPAAPATSAPADALATVPVQTAAKLADIPAGVDSAGNFYRGDPKASLKLIEYSDFQ